jgi:hypothetical protein
MSESFKGKSDSENPILFFQKNDISEYLDILRALKCEKVSLLLLETVQKFSNLSDSTKSKIDATYLFPIIIREAQFHICYAGEVVNDEDYTQGLQILTKLNIGEKYDAMLRQANAYPSKIWSAKEIIQETKLYAQRIHERVNHNNKVVTGFLPIDFFDDFPEPLHTMSRHHWVLENYFIYYIGRLYTNDQSNIRASITSSLPHSRFCATLNPFTPKIYLEPLTRDGNRYVRATARAALEMRGEL